MSISQSFPLRDLVCVATGSVPVNDRAGALAVVRHMIQAPFLTDDFLHNHIAQCKADLLAQLPWLAEHVAEEAPYHKREEWIGQLMARYGEMHEVNPLPSSENSRIFDVELSLIPGSDWYMPEGDEPLDMWPFND